MEDIKHISQDHAHDHAPVEAFECPAAADKETRFMPTIAGRHPLDWLQLVLLVITLAYTLGVQEQRLKQVEEWRVEHEASFVRMIADRDQHMNELERKDVSESKLEVIRQQNLILQSQIRQQNAWLLAIMQRLNISPGIVATQ